MKCCPNLGIFGQKAQTDREFFIHPKTGSNEQKTISQLFQSILYYCYATASVLQRFLS
jgi:hypothetical protein